jgi:beta-glucosidase
MKHPQPFLRQVKIILPALLFFSGYTCSRVEPYKNPKLSIEKRVNDLVSRMTLDEKISQMMDMADSIPRLRIPRYNWWNEGLHGVARAGIATVFPQAIGLSATFNDSLMYEVGAVISDEFRAKYNHFIGMGEHDRYKGLTVWSPNINIFRDPRWGRGQETYGEDPFLTARMGVSFVKGMQGNNSKYLKVVSTPKHYAVHSGPEPLRHVFNANVSQRDFMDTYLPGFEACIREGKAQSVMGAYNRFRGQACCGSPYLLTHIIREKWGFDGYVVSDCGAIYDIFGNHKVASSEAEAAAIAVKAGCDLNCGHTFENLKEAVDKGFITEKQIDVSLKRLMTARFRLGMFDPPGMVPYDTIPYEVNDSKSHRELSVDVARQTMVLLKNSDNVLPLNRNIKTIAVIGPNADEPEVMFGNYNGTPSSYITPLEGVKRKVSTGTKVLYSRGCNLHQDMHNFVPVDARYVTSNGKPGLTGEYFTNKSLEGTPAATRNDQKISFFWFDDTPMPSIGHENFSIRWKGNFTAPKSGRYEFRIRGDDGYRLYIDGKLLIDKWENQDMQGHSAYINFDSASQHSIRVDYYQEIGIGAIFLDWALPEGNIELEALNYAKQADVIVFVGGLSSKLEGEEMRVDLTGFKGGDRTTLNLPASQENLLKKLKATGKPVILVLLNGSALSINWADVNIPAILEAWYPGQEGGTAIADVLFGDYNPAGRLPVTFYKSVDQLPPFEDYNMKGRTYRYFEGEPLYPFGYGLSYTSFTYSNLIAPDSISTTDTVSIKVNVENTGSIDGDEVLELYLKHPDAPVSVPVHALEGFKRIHLKKGEKKTVTFLLSPFQLTVINDSNQRIVLPGAIQLFVGGKQPDEKNTEQGDVLNKIIKVTGEENMIEQLDR